jgi:hypothetical protein
LWVGLLREGGVAGPGPSCHTLRSKMLCVDEVLDVAHVSCSLVCGSMDLSEANLDLWIEPTLFLDQDRSQWCTLE